MKLGLGTVQFGLDYGITNRGGRPHAEVVRQILELAARTDIDTLDTAALYGDSERVIGDALPRPHDFRIVTKTLALDPRLNPADAIATIEAGVVASLQRLKEPRIYGLLLHRVDDLLGPLGEQLFAKLEGLKAQGLVEKIGVSLYTPSEVDAVLSRYAPDLVQLPLNPFDQRHLASRSLERLAAASVEIHVRSAFLQGLLLASPANPPPQLAELAPKLLQWRRLLEKQNLPPLQGCFGFLQGIPQLGYVICGATNLVEWQEILAAWQSAPMICTETFKELSVSDVKLIDPRFWPQP